MTATSHVVAPGECLREWIEEHGVSLQRVAGLMGCSRERVSGIPCCWCAPMGKLGAAVSG